MKPSDFLNFPFDSVKHNNESETVAQNIMVILARTGDTFRELSWPEYVVERNRDGNFSQKERRYFDGVIDYCGSAEQAMRFSPEWRKGVSV